MRIETSNTFSGYYTLFAVCSVYIDATCEGVSKSEFTTLTLDTAGVKMSLVAALLVLLASGVLSDSQTLCGGTFNAAMFNVASPPYGPGLRCQIAVLPSSAAVCGLELDLGSLSLPCPSDQLTVDGEPLCGVPPGAVVQAPLRSPQTDISFRGNPEGGEGFNITVKQIDCQSGSFCDKEFTSEITQIVSSGYPYKYPGGFTCMYTIKPSDPAVCQVEITFSDSSLDSSDNCTKDSLTIGNDLLCGTLDGKKIYDIDRSLKIVFLSGDDGGEKGFNLTARQIKCAEVIGGPPPLSADINGHLVSEKVDCGDGNARDISRDGYPVYSAPYPPFPDNQRQNSPPLGNYLPPFNQRVPVGQVNPVVPPFMQYFPTNPSYSSSHHSSFQFQNSRPQQVPETYYGRPSVYRTPSYQISQYVPPYRQHLPPYTPSTPRPFAYWPVQSYVRQSAYQLECCNQIYNDSHFLLVSPGFPRSTTSDCVYTISRYSSLTYQIRYQFRYFWTGEDTGTGCSGGYLEIDGTKVCGCKTGVSWTSQFSSSETYKSLHLKLDTKYNRLFNGFVLEVYQDDSYSGRFERANEADEDVLNNTQLSPGFVANFSQYVETYVEREPLISPGNEYQLLDRTASQPIWDSSRQGWTLPTDWFCLRWNFQDWLILAREVLWAKYQCPVSSSSSSSVLRSDVAQSDSCRTCLYLCRNNCQCCQP